MTSLLLVHSPLVGRSMWDGLVAELHESGVDATALSVEDLLAEEDFWTRAVARVDAAPGDVVVLYSASGLMGGALRSDRPTVFLDAQLPRAGGDWWSTVPADLRTRLAGLIDGDSIAPFWSWWDPEVIATAVPEPATRQRFIADCPPIPRSLFHAPLPSGTEPEGRAGYVMLSQGYTEEHTTASSLGWPTASLDGSHLSVVSDPVPVARAVIEVVAALGS